MVSAAMRPAGPAPITATHVDGGLAGLFTEMEEDI